MPNSRASTRSPRPRSRLHHPALLALLAAPAALSACRRPQQRTAPAAPPLPPTASWRTLAAHLDVRDAAATGAPLRWTVPRACPLTYQYTATIDNRMDPMPEHDDAAPVALEAQGIAVEGEVVGRAETASPARWDLHVVSNHLAFLHEGARNPGVGDGPDGLAAPEVHTDGTRWTEDDGPTALWSAYGSFNGLALFFPALPAGARPGSEARWPLVLHPQGAGNAVEARRRGLPPPERTPPDHAVTEDITVRLARWITVAGQRAAELSAHWRGGGHEDERGEPGVGVAAERRGRAYYVVLASGRLLHAALERDEDVTIRAPDMPAPMRQHSRLVAEARLVAACDGPTLPRFATAPRDPQELATDAYARLLSALDRSDAAAASGLLAPALTAAHAPPDVLRALRDARARFGDDALRPPVMADQFVREGAVVQFDSPGLVRGFNGSPRTTGHVTVRVEVADGRARVVSIVGTDGVAPFLEVTPAALRVAASDAADRADGGTPRD